MTRPRPEPSYSDLDDSTGSSSHSTLIAFDHGTGLMLYRNLLLPAVLNAKFEIILATCFWAPSETLTELVSALRELSCRVVTTKQHEAPSIKVYICFSSRSITQKLFHTSSEDGHVYPPEQWPSDLGLPSPSELPGLDITIKSIFFRPFSVLHSKYLIVDRQTVFFPSCNVSWEDWYECAIGLEGPIVRDTFNFWKKIWKPAGLVNVEGLSSDLAPKPSYTPSAEPSTGVSEHVFKTTLLPHLHNASLQQSLWFIPKADTPLPRSPLNTTLLRLITNAKSEVLLLTPNFTSSAAFAAVCSALSRGVCVHLITDRKMMVPEQLATAGLMTEQSVDSLIKEYQTGFNGHKLQARLTRLEEFLGQTLKSPSHSAIPGKLRISYFHQPPHTPLPSVDRRQTRLQSREDVPGIASKATKSHIKLTLVDRKAIILGSGNMDRASWRTSQELGILIEDKDNTDDSTSIAERLWREVEIGLSGCLETYFDG